WAVFLIIVRELTIMGMRTLAAVQGKLLSAELWGKWKMAIQSGTVMAILAFLVLRDAWGVPIPDWASRAPWYLVFLNFAVTWASALRYLRQNRVLLRNSWNPQGKDAD